MLLCDADVVRQVFAEQPGKEFSRGHSPTTGQGCKRPKSSCTWGKHLLTKAWGLDGGSVDGAIS